MTLTGDRLLSAAVLLAAVGLVGPPAAAGSGPPRAPRARPHRPLQALRVGLAGRGWSAETARRRSRKGRGVGHTAWPATARSGRRAVRDRSTRCAQRPRRPGLRGGAGGDPG